MDTIAEVDEQFPDYARLLDDLARALQRIAVCQVVGATAYEDDLDDEKLAELAGQIPAEDIQLFYQIAINGRRDLYLAPDPRSGVEMTLLRMLAFRPGGEATNAAGTAHRAVARKSAAPVASRQKTVAAANTGASTEVAGEAHRWQEPEWGPLVQQLGLTAVTKQLASNCAYVRRDGNTLFLSLDNRSESYLTRDRQETLAIALSDYFGEPLKVDIAVGQAEQETPVQAEKRRESEQLDAARAGLEADPNVQALKDMFGAELVADSVAPLPDK